MTAACAVAQDFLRERFSPPMGFDYEWQAREELDDGGILVALVIDGQFPRLGWFPPLAKLELWPRAVRFVVAEALLEWRDR